MVVFLRPPGRATLVEVIDDPFEFDLSRRFKMMYMEQGAEGEAGDGLAPDQRLRVHAYSADGIQWSRYPWELHHISRLFGVLAYLDAVPTGPVDTPDARYIFYGQRGSPWKTRQIGRRDSNNFVNWSDNRPVVESRVSDRPLGLEFYCLQGPIVNQTYAALYLGMLGGYQTDLRRKLDPTRNDGLTESLLAYSRDSMRWDRWDVPFISRGSHGAFDWGGIYCQFPVISADSMLFFYSGESGRHGKKSEPTVGMAMMRPDGFVSVETEGFMDGVLTTRPHHWTAGEVQMNVQSATGHVSVQLQDETGRPFDGFADADCNVISEDALEKTVSWRRAGSNVGSLQGKMVGLKNILVPDDKLFSYTLGTVEN